jgi:hypothetical protein
MTTAALALSASALASEAFQPNRETDQQILEKLDVVDMEYLQLDLPPFPGPPVDLTVNLDGTDYILEMRWYSMRSVDFVLIEVDDDGEHIVHDVPKSATYRGAVLDASTGEEVGRVASTIDENKLWAQILIGDASSMLHYGIQPIADVIDDVPAREHVLYRSTDILPHDKRCGVDDLDMVGIDGEVGGGSFQAQEAGDEICDLVCEADFPFWQTIGNRTGVVREMQLHINTVENLYEVAGIDITYEITAFKLRKTSGSDPYTTTSPGTLLDQFRDEYQVPNLSHARRDTAHLFTGRFTGGVIGIANLTVICSQGSGFGISDTTFSSNMTTTGGLVAHELGHNWSAQHCDGDGDCRIMCSGLGGCGPVTSFGSSATNQIVNHKNSRGCLEPDTSDRLSPPFFDDFESGNFDTDLWNYVEGANVGTGATNEPSGSFSMRLNSTGVSRFLLDDVRSNHLDLRNVTTATLSFFYQENGVEAGEELKVDGYTQGNNWTNITRVTATGTNPSTFSFFSVDLQAIATNYDHKNFRMRFKAKVDSTGDRWSVDDVSVTTTLAMIWRPFPHFYEKRGGTLRMVGGDEGQRVLFFATLSDGSGTLNGANDESEWIPLGGAFANTQGVATLEVPMPSSMPDVDVRFFALTFAADGSTLEVQPIDATIR